MSVSNATGTASPCLKQPPTADELRELDLIARHRERPEGETWSEQTARLKANADPETDALLATGLELPPDVADSLGGDSLDKARHSACRVKLARRRNGAPEVVAVPCRRRGCTECASGWQASKLTILDTVADALAPGGILDGDPALTIGEIDESEWRATSTRLRRHGAGYESIPLPGDRRQVVSNDPDFGVCRPYDEIRRMVAEALASTSERAATDRRQVTISQTWREIAAERLITPEPIEDDAEIEWLGIVRKETTPAKIQAAARRCGAIAAPVAPLETDPEDARVWRVANLDPAREWKFWALLGLTSWDELAAERDARRFEDQVRQQRYDLIAEREPRVAA